MDVSMLGCAERQYKQDLHFLARRKIFDPWEGINTYCSWISDEDIKTVKCKSRRLAPLGQDKEEEEEETERADLASKVSLILVILSGHNKHCRCARWRRSRRRWGTA